MQRLHYFITNKLDIILWFLINIFKRIYLETKSGK